MRTPDARNGRPGKPHSLPKTGRLRPNAVAQRSAEYLALADDRAERAGCLRGLIEVEEVAFEDVAELLHQGAREAG